MTRNTSWFRQPAMLVVAGVLTFTLISGTATIALSLANRDALLMSDADFRAWRDDMRATGAPDAASPGAPSPDTGPTKHTARGND